ncbi:MAG: D-tyrosyl-tRNA(Tyr) deacylase [Planctomycetes bacterium]|nr:D-tyrosyl-tRNA(Tyr) deacylase [Planctomycetota bacterium]
MRAVLQRVGEASVTVREQDVAGRIGKGLLILLGVGPDDTEETARALATKISKLRIFEDDNEKMNLSLLDIRGAALVVSQFTLFADTRKGNRPSFIAAAPPELAEPLCKEFCNALEEAGIHVEEGVFGAHMDVRLINDGPVTIIMEM